MIARRLTEISKFAIVLCASCLLASCSTVPQNKPLNFAAPGSKYEYEAIAGAGRSNNMLVIVAMSGGGKRSAAFGFGVLKALRDTRLTTGGKARTLLDEVDFINAVSGGSFTAAFYGLEREKIFDGRYEKFLKESTERAIALRLLAPWNILGLFGVGRGTNEVIARYWDQRLFKNRTYRDMAAKGPPVINIQATDANHGSVFVFNQLYFDLICSSLQSYPVARAVAASNAFPGLFSPIALANRSSKCQTRRPKWIKRALAKPDLTSRRYHIARALNRYLDDEKNKYIHLMDGGVVDALALRGSINSVTLLGPSAPFSDVKHLVVIVANAQAKPDRGYGRSSKFPGIFSLLSAASGAQIDSYSFETIALAKATAQQVARRLTARRCGRRVNCARTKVHFVLLTFENIRSSRIRNLFNSMRTALQLKNRDAERLIKAGYGLTLQNPAYRSLIKSVGGTMPTVKPNDAE